MTLPAACPATDWSYAFGDTEPITCWAQGCDRLAPDDGLHLCARHRAELLPAPTVDGRWT